MSITKFERLLLDLCYQQTWQDTSQTWDALKEELKVQTLMRKEKINKLAHEFLFHMADISNPTKPWLICKRWTDLLFVEFFNQGDRERELGIDISFLMDRTTTNSIIRRN